MKKLENKTIIITGASSGIGKMLAIKLAEEGSNIILIDKNEPELIKLKNLIGSKSKSYIYTCDISKYNEVKNIREEIIKETEVDILINNAGVSSFGLFKNISMELMEWTINTNYWGTVYMTKEFLPLLESRPEAHIVNVSSVYGLLGIPGQSAYCSSKFAIRGFTEALRQEYYNSSINFSIVFPGGVKTNIVKNSRTDNETTEHLKAKKEFEQSLMNTPEYAAEQIINGIKKNRKRILIGKDAKAIDKLARWKADSYDKIIYKHITKNR